jgi:diphthamide synthase (EF-2-diphthine--ammonia ligase)
MEIVGAYAVVGGWAGYLWGDENKPFRSMLRGGFVGLIVGVVALGLKESADGQRRIDGAMHDYYSYLKQPRY